MKKSVLVKSALALALTAGFSTAANAGCGNGSLYCSGSSFNNTSFSGTSQYVPFTSSAPTTGPVSLSGLGSNEYLSPTSCPVDVNGLQSGQSVLGCYQVVKRQQQTVRYHYAAPTTVRVVRPVIYVRYPVPTPYYTYAPQPCAAPFFRPAPVWGGGCGW